MDHPRHRLPINLLLCCGDVGKLKFRQILPQLVFCAFQADVTLELTGDGKTLQHRLSSIQVTRMDITQAIPLIAGLTRDLLRPLPDNPVRHQPKVPSSIKHNMLPRLLVIRNRELLHLHVPHLNVESQNIRNTRVFIYL